jgi:hypothetical protein
MVGQGRFPSEFDAAISECATGSDYRFSAEGAGARTVAVEVQPSDGARWIATYAAPDPGRRALSALLGTPSRTGLCVVERGTAFLGDVLRPAAFEVIRTPGPVVAAEELAGEGVLLLVTPWAMTGVGASGALWTSRRIAIDGLRVDEASEGWVRGVTDPDDEEPRDFAVDLSSGQVVGGLPSA